MRVRTNDVKIRLMFDGAESLEDVCAQSSIAFVDLHGFDYVTNEYQIIEMIKNPRIRKSV